MTTYADIHERVRTILVNPSSRVDAEIPRYVFEAHKRLEERHAWLACESEIAGIAIPGYNEVRSFAPSRAYLRLLDRKEPRPYGVPVSGQQDLAVSEISSWTYFNDAGTSGILRVRLSHQAGDPDLPSFAAGQRIAIRHVANSSSDFLIPYINQRAGIISSVVPTGSFLTDINIAWNDAGVSNLSGAHNAADKLWLYTEASGRPFPLEWLESPDDRRHYGGTQAQQKPRHVRVTGYETDGLPVFAVYPTPDAVYELRVPCLLSLLPSATELPSGSASNWLTDRGFEVLSQMAAAEGFRDEWNAEKTREHEALAERMIASLRAYDARMRVNASTLRVSQDARGPSAPSTTRW